VRDDHLLFSRPCILSKLLARRPEGRLEPVIHCAEVPIKQGQRDATRRLARAMARSAQPLPLPPPRPTQDVVPRPQIALLPAHILLLPADRTFGKNAPQVEHRQQRIEATRPPCPKGENRGGEPNPLALAGDAPNLSLR
jgi:hypothetical protein